MYFDPVTGACVIKIEQKIYLYINLKKYFLGNSLSVSLHLLRDIWINELHYFHEEICFTINGCHVIRKKTISQLS